MTSKSFFLFIVPADESMNSPNDMVIVGADPTNQRFLVYDPCSGREAAWFSQVEVIRPFVADYIDTYGQYRACQYEASFEDYEDEKIEVKNWPVQDGICSKIDTDILAKHGSGIFITKFLDLITRQKAPHIEFDNDEIVDDLYN